MYLPSSQHADDVHGLAPGLDDLRADFHAYLVDDPQDIPFGHRRIRAHDEIGSSEDVKVGHVVGHVEGGVEKLAELLGRGRRIDVEDVVAGLRRGEMVRLGADAADARGDIGELLDATALRELLESRSSGMTMYADATSPWSSRKRSILPCPSRRVTGSIVIFFMALSLSHLPPVQEGSGQAEPVEGPDGIGDLIDDAGGLLLGVCVHHGRARRHEGSALVNHVGGRTIAAPAGHIDLRAEGAAASSRSRPRADEALVEEALGGAGDDLVEAVELLDGFLFSLVLTLVADGLLGGAYDAPLGREIA